MTATLPDNARKVRDEDRFDVSAVHSWLRASQPDEALFAGPEPDVRQFSGGASNLTYLLRYRERDLILRRPPVGTKASSAHDMGREFRIQSALAPVFPYVPGMVGLCTDDAVLGADFYVMDRIDGTVLRKNPPADLPLPPARARALCEDAVDRLVDLHAVDAAAAGLSPLSRGDGYVGRQVEGWTRRYRDARTWNVPSYDKVMAWLAERQPADAGTVLIHNDYRLDNLVLRDSGGASPEIVGVLDWELATVGDPLMDLGSSLAYWAQEDDDRVFLAQRRQPSSLPGMLTRREIVERYLAATGRSGLDDWPFYEVFGLFRLAGIAQQIYYRYHHKQSRNPAFRNYWLYVVYLERRCRRLMREAGAGVHGTGGA